MTQIEGKIAAILDPSTVVINRGSLDGVSKGLKFYIYTELGPFNDPDTGEDLGTITKVWGRVVVSKVTDRLCIARTEYEYISGLNVLGIFSGRRVQVELPVDGAEIMEWTDKVSVGTEVISERVQAAISAPEQVQALPGATDDSTKSKTSQDQDGSQSSQE